MTCFGVCMLIFVPWKPITSKFRHCSKDVASQCALLLLNLMGIEGPRAHARACTHTHTHAGPTPAPCWRGGAGKPTGVPAVWCVLIIYHAGPRTPYMAPDNLLQALTVPASCSVLAVGKKAMGTHDERNAAGRRREHRSRTFPRSDRPQADECCRYHDHMGSYGQGDGGDMEKRQR